MSHTCRSFWQTVSTEYALCQMFSLCPACHRARRPRAVASPVPKRRAPRSTKWSLWGPAQSFRHTQSITQLSAEDWEGRLLQPLGWAWPPCWVRHCHACTRARPALHNAAVEPRVATAFLSSAMALMMATGRPLWARLIPEAETRLQYPWMSKYPANRTLP